MHGYRFRLPTAGFCWGLCGVVLSGFWSLSWSNETTGATLAKRSQADAPATSDYVPPRPTPAPEAEPIPLPESLAPPVPQPGPWAPNLGPVPYYPPSRPPIGPPPPGAICRPVPTVAEPVAALGVSVTWPAEGGGVLVLDVAPYSPAAYAGLVRGDRILAINHQLISTPKILVGYLRHKLPGARIWIAYWRHGAIQSTNTILNLKEMIPGAEPETQPVPFWQARRDGRQPEPKKHDVVLAQSIPR